MTIAQPTEEEVRELYFLFSPEKSAHPRMPTVPQISLQARDVAVLMKILEECRSTNISRSHLEKQLVEAGQHFPESVYLQDYPSPSKLERKFGHIQSAALKLVDMLEVKAGRPFKLPVEITAWLQMAASEYGNRIGQPKPRPPRGAIHWNFWEACKLPSVVASVVLLEHWAGMARRQLRKGMGKKRRNSGDTAFRVLVHRLALIWIGNTGKRPGAGYSAQSGAESRFTRFVGQYLASMKAAITPDHERDVLNIKRELSRSHESIRAQVRVFNNRLPKQKARG